jgi:hypothetical protein
MSGQAMGVAALGQEGVDLGRRDAALLRLVAGIDLDQPPPSRPGTA